MSAADEFRRGLQAEGDARTDPSFHGGVASTRLRSPWLHRRCPRCDHSFRRDDRVKLTPEGEAVHTDDTPFCGAGGPLDLRDRRDRGMDVADVDREFLEGFAEGCPAPPVQLLRLMPGDPVLVRGPFGRRTCPVCAHTLRPYDEVVPCPCFPGAARCGALVHHDPFHQMPCTHDWNDRAGKRACPVTAVVFDL
jgi:hypothetical protein